MSKYSFDVNKVKEDIKSADVVSFDIFDTFLIRDFYQPVDLFKYMEIKYQLPEFQRNRIRAEVKSRTEHPDRAEIGYEDIYKNLSQYDKSLELDTEKKACVVNPEIKELYDYAVSLGKKIIAISDMYLEESFILELLRDNGYNDFAKIYVSSKIGKTKSQEALYRYVLDDLKLQSHRLLHIGDNYESDYVAAKNQGVQVIYYKSLRERASENTNSYLLRSLERSNSPQASLFAALLTKRSMILPENEYWYRFGFSYTGIILFHFVTNVYNYCKSNNLSRIYFMARDGQIIKEAFDFLYEKDKEISSFYMYASRRLFHIAAIKKFDESEIEKLTVSAPNIPYSDILNRLGFQWLIDEAKEYFQDIQKPIKSATDREALKRFFALHKIRIEEEIVAEKENLFNYLKSIEFFKDNKKLLVDIGWGCSSQKHLESLLDEKFYAMYFGTTKGAYRHTFTKGYFFDNGLPKKNSELALSSLPLVELLFAGNHYSIMKIDSEGQPVYHKKSSYEDIRIEVANKVHKGAIEFIKSYRELLDKYKLPIEQEIDYTVLTSLLIKPDIEDIVQISKIPHAASLGEASYEPIIKNLHQTQWEFFKNILLGKMSENSSLWPNGNKRYKQLMNKKHYKSIDFLLYVMTKIQHCYSYSFSICIKKIILKVKRYL